MYQSRYYDTLFNVAAVVVVAALVFAVVGSFLGAVVRVLRRVQPESRRMEPWQVWLNLVPVFNLVWGAVTIERVAESLRAEFASRGLHGPEENYGRRPGLRALVLVAIGLALLYVKHPPAPLVLVAGVLALLYAVGYWGQMRRYAERLKPGAYAPPPTDEGW